MRSFFRTTPISNSASAATGHFHDEESGTSGAAGARVAAIGDAIWSCCQHDVMTPRRPVESEKRAAASDLRLLCLRTDTNVGEDARGESR
jgi:hypothetical protein